MTDDNDFVVVVLFERFWNLRARYVVVRWTVFRELLADPRGFSLDGKAEGD